MSLSSDRPVLIIGSGEDVPQNPPVIRSSAVICADGGAALARSWGLIPSMILGDWDSLDGTTKKYWQGRGVPMQRFPIAKDQTDLELAVEYALQHGAREIHLTGAWGSRIDHSLGNLELLYRLATMKIPNLLYTRNQRLSAFDETFSAQVRVGSTVSLIPLSPVVEGVATEGLLYPLVDATLKRGSTFTVSNQAIEENISLRLGVGILLVIFE